MRHRLSAKVLLILAVLTNAARMPAARASRPVFDTRNFQAMLELQIRLDRSGFSPGFMDGGLGRNAGNALGTFSEANGQPVRSTISRVVLTCLGTTGSRPLAAHAIADSDLAGPFKEIPSEVCEKPKLDCLSDRSPLEGRSERFHSSRPACAMARASNSGTEPPALHET